MVTDAADITTLINTVLVVTIPSITGMIMGILSFINHKTNSTKIHNITAKVGENAAKIDAYAEQAAASTGKIESGIELAEDLSPAVKDAIVKNHPVVVDLQSKVADLQAKLDKVNAYVDTLDSSPNTPN